MNINNTQKIQCLTEDLNKGQKKRVRFKYVHDYVDVVIYKNKQVQQITKHSILRMISERVSPMEIIHEDIMTSEAEDSSFDYIIEAT